MNERTILEHATTWSRKSAACAKLAGAEAGERLAQIEEELDQCWDLLRQRRAKREFGDDPEQAPPRDADTVEGYIG